MKIINVPNSITFIRLLLILPFCLALMNNNMLQAQVLLIIIVISDGIDGYLARKLKQETGFGKSFDAFVDTIFLTSGLIIVCMQQRIKLVYLIMVLLPRPIVFIREMLRKKAKYLYDTSIYRKIIAIMTATLLFAATLKEDINMMAIAFSVIIYALLIADFFTKRE